MKKKKKWPMIVGVIIALIVILIAGVGVLFQKELKIIGSIRKIGGDHPFYVMSYEDSYHLDDILEQGASSDSELAEILTKYISHGFYSAPSSNKTSIGCSTLTAMTPEGKMIWGRNFDWYYTVPIIVKSQPEDGYASISTCEFTNITGDSTVLPENMANKFLAVAAYYVPMDGINEKGLCVADLQVNEGGQTVVDTEKTDITVTMAIRLLLDKAATVDEAINLLKQYDICPSGGISSHLSISDATGRAVAVEFMDGEIVVVESPMVTNFNLANGDISAGGESAMNRYLLLQENWNVCDGIMDKEDLKQSMMDVAQYDGEWKTKWTVVYQYSEEDVQADYYWNGDYATGFQIGINDEID